MSPALWKMIKARAELILDHPFFATLALRLELREDPGCATAWSDGSVLAFNPAYIEAQPLARVKGMQCHEVLHLACSHHTRRGNRESRIWNRACDYAINPILLDAGLELPDGFLDDPAHHGKSADAIYETLLAEMDEVRGGAQSGAEQEAESDENMDAAAGGDRSLGGRDSAASGGRPEDRSPGLTPAGGGGGRSAGNGDPGQSGEVRDAPVRALGSANDGDGPDQEDEWRMAVAQAARVAREAGNMPGALERFLTAALEPRLGWRELLRRFVTESARTDFSWVRPNRRFIHAGLYLPGLDNPELARIAVAVDVSGSIGQEALDSFAGELSCVLEDFDTEIGVMTCDVDVTTSRRMTRQDLPLRLSTRGSGGTDFRPPFELIVKEGEVPACLIYFTDLQCTRYPEEPGYPVLWVTAKEPQSPPPFGEVVVMEHAL
jgi:predicted metal-dependent peptidase